MADPTKDIRSFIARSKQYNPDLDVEYVHQEYPKYVRRDGAIIGVAHDADEEQKLLGVVETKAKPIAVDVAQAVTQGSQNAPAPKRGRPPKAKTIDLPADLP